MFISSLRHYFSLWFQKAGGSDTGVMCPSLTPELQTVIKEGGSCTVLDQPIPLDRLVVKSIDPLHVSGLCQFSSSRLSVCHCRVLCWPFLVTARKPNLSLHKSKCWLPMRLYSTRSPNRLWEKECWTCSPVLAWPTLPLAGCESKGKETAFLCHTSLLGK